MRVAQRQKMRHGWQDEYRELRGHQHGRERRGKREGRQDTGAPADTKEPPPTRARWLVEHERLRAAGLRSSHSSSAVRVDESRGPRGRLIDVVARRVWQDQLSGGL